MDGPKGLALGRTGFDVKSTNDVQVRKTILHARPVIYFLRIFFFGRHGNQFCMELCSLHNFGRASCEDHACVVVLLFITTDDPHKH